MILSNKQYFDETLNIKLICDFFEEHQTNDELVSFAFDYLDNRQALEYLLDYTGLEDEFEEYLKTNWEDYIEEDDEEEEEEETEDE